MTAVILVSINPWLALVTLLPLPLIAWLIHVRARPPAHRLREGRPRLGRSDQRAGRHHSRHPRGQGLRPGEARGRSASARPTQHNLAVNDRVNKVWSLFSPTVTLLTEIGLLVVWAFGIWQVSQRRDHRRRADRLPRLHRPLLRAARFDEPHRLGHAEGRRRRQAHLRHPRPRFQRARAGQPGASGAGQRRASSCATSASATAPAPSSAASTSTIEPGEMIGLVGHSGSGKSTLVNLICRFYDVTEGAILRRRRRHPLAAAWPNTAATSASCCRSRSCSSAPSPRTSPTASPTRRREEIVAAARAAHAHEFILRLPHGYDSLVGERGQALSGGERQRISHRPRAADRSAHPDPRRGHLLGRHRDREGNPEGARQPGARPHHDRHRPPPVHAAQGRPAGRDGPRPHRRGRQARRS